MITLIEKNVNVKAYSNNNYNHKSIVVCKKKERRIRLVTDVDKKGMNHVQLVTILLQIMQYLAVPISSTYWGVIHEQKSWNCPITFAITVK